MDSAYVIAYLILGVNLVYRLLLRAYQGWRLHLGLLVEYAFLGGLIVYLVVTRRGYSAPTFALTVLFFCLVFPVPYFLKRLSGAFALQGSYGPARFFALFSYIFAWSRENLFLYQFLTGLALRDRAGRSVEGLAAVKSHFQKILGEIPSPELRGAALAHLVSMESAARRWTEAARVHHDLASLVEEELPPELLLQLVRAHAEVGDFDAGLACQEKLEERRGWPEQALLGRIFLSALAGEPGAVRSLFADHAPIVRGWPACLCPYWIGRAHLAAGEREAARFLFGTALEETPVSEAVWREAIEEQLSLASLPEPPTARLPDASARERLARVVSPPLAAVRRSVTTALFAARRQVQPVTAALLGAMAIVFLLEEGRGGSTDPYALMRCGAIYEELVHPAGEYWRLVSHMFVHMHWLHIFMNAYFLYVFGNLLESFYGRAKFFVIYLLSGVGGAVSSVGLRFLMAHASGRLASVKEALGLARIEGPMGGASGAVMGLLGCAIAFAVRHKRQLDPSTRKFLIFNFIVIFALIVGSGFAFDLIAPGGVKIDNWAHLGGGLAGMALAAFINPDRFQEGGASRTRRALMRALVALALGLAAWSGIEVARSLAGAGYPRRELPMAEVTSPRYLSVAYPSLWRSFSHPSRSRNNSGEILVAVEEPWRFEGNASLWVQIAEMRPSRDEFGEFQANYMTNERESLGAAGAKMGRDRPHDSGRPIDAGGRRFHLHAQPFSVDVEVYQVPLVRHYYFHLAEEGIPIVFVFEFREDLEEDYEVLAHRVLASVRRLAPPAGAN